MTIFVTEAVAGLLVGGSWVFTLRQAGCDLYSIYKI
jgi:hypothetical protein